MTISAQTTELLIPSWNQNSTSSGIDPVVVNRFITDTRIENLCLRLFVYRRLISDAQIKKCLKGQIEFEVEEQ